MTGSVVALDVVGSGACLHDVDVAWLDREVIFIEPCPGDCPEVLRAEGYMVLVTQQRDPVAA